MKRASRIAQSPWLMAVVVFAVLFVAWHWGAPYTLKGWESSDLWLDSPDYYVLLREYSSPLWHCCVNYLRQFFYYPLAGPALIALGAVMVFLLLCLVLRHWAFRLIVALIIVGLHVGYLMKSDVRENERWAHLEQSAEYGQWSEVLRIATPQQTATDRKMLPYALLAHAVQNDLPETLLQYPIQGPEDFDSQQGATSPRYYHFKMILNSCMGAPLEAIHCNFQHAAFLPLGTSFGTLRRLVRFNHVAGNLALESKYQEILSHSTLHAAWQHQSGLHPDTLRSNQSGHIPTVTKSFGFNLGVMMDQGNYTPQMFNYMLCWLLSSRNLRTFTTMLQGARQFLPSPLPLIYQQALEIYAHEEPSFDPSLWDISIAVHQDFQFYLQHGGQPTSYFSYYYRGK